MQNSHKYQHFALDINNNIVNIKNIVVSDKQKYYCPYCHDEMIAKCGNIRQWHFAHKVNKCSYDNYLHSIAEIMIKDWFNQQDSIMLYYDNKEKCSKYNSCIFYDDMNCCGNVRVSVDFKKYYSKCILEHGYGGFVADLYCESEKHLDSPIFIEIFVTHKCSLEKRKSGIRIIELLIRSEEDILSIIKSSKLEECEFVRLYNFKRKVNFVDKFIQPVQKYILYPTQRSYVNRDLYTCKNYDKRRSGIYEMSMIYDDCIPYFINGGGFYMVGKVKAYVDGYLKKDCQLCKWQAEDWHGNRFCKLYKKCGNPKNCSDNNVLNCSMFRADMDIINNAVADFNENIEKNKVDVWKIDKF